ncbi:bacterioferritin [uncultured Desulfovibrio sp.]|uniref:Bacterioferritin n=1 Tax=Candidatus Desulfovibrio intestinavium TaxID=2838534 RepID=A0A9D2HKM3_9BACT|nr:bacterioferritin [uncultured Desulfovibrio sp.]HJA78665.1 bacterioferritin [Candidatus Desulfovibrio intestinavium]
MGKDRKERKANVIEVLNKARGMELYAVHQYMNQHYSLDSLDYGELAANMKLIAIDEMKHAEAFAERIKELGGEPTSEKDGKIKTGEEVLAIYEGDAAREDATIDAYNSFIKVCNENGDIITARLFERIIDEEQAHMNYYENIAEHIKSLGAVYLAKIAGTPSSTGPSKGFVQNNGNQG